MMYDSIRNATYSIAYHQLILRISCNIAPRRRKYRSTNKYIPHSIMPTNIHVLIAINKNKPLDQTIKAVPEMSKLQGVKVRGFDLRKGIQH